ncbi:metallophosphoesterase family protein [Belliella kenyensis]|uniref:Phosphoesterase n=1 Tax=Belliella kenyensis TaxID=1472724 RepID=A0ABV8EQA9_9BACT|nr:metallophosphoesterase family protein [Belliella kenyensis]MCH7403585.1 metallophosphatase family protein [Belliella kenyensis]MDN3603863.1 metallophosphoesterase family protein [Belliella kenyensis]
MKRIGLISDSHGYIDDAIIEHLSHVDEIWHAGDIGDLSTLNALPKGKVLRVVTGNIDDHVARSAFPEELWFEVEGLKIGMLHIGGKPPRYANGIKKKIRDHHCQLFVCGHSHICKVEFDPSVGCLYMNPGAIGRHGFHMIRTMLIFEIETGQLKNLNVIELGKRSQI